MTQTIEIPVLPHTPCMLGETPVASFTVRAIGFLAYARVASEAAKVSKDERGVTRALFRARLRTQVTAYAADKKPVPLTEQNIGDIPARYAVALKAAISDVLATVEAPPAKIVTEGDGATSAIEVQLGTPLILGKDRTCGFLEFLAEKLSDLEDVLATDNRLDRAVAFLALAKPVDAGSLQTLPSAAMETLSLADGLFLMERVVDPFFEQLGAMPS